MCMPWRHQQWEPIAKIFLRIFKIFPFGVPFYPQLAGLVPFSPFKHARGVPYVFDSAHFPFWDGRNTDGCDAKKVEGRTPDLPRLWKIAGIRGENCDSGETRMELGASRCVFYANSWPSVSCTSYPHHRGCIVLRIVSLSLGLQLQ